MNNQGLIFPKLTERQKDLYLKIIVNLNTYGYFDRGFGSNGVHYASAAENPFKDKGIDCENCAFYYLEGDAPRCELIQGGIEAEAICKFWIVSDEDIKKESQAAFKVLNKKNKTFEVTYRLDETKEKK
jgi:hypothetical protein